MIVRNYVQTKYGMDACYHDWNYNVFRLMDLDIKKAIMGDLMNRFTYLTVDGSIVKLGAYTRWCQANAPLASMKVGSKFFFDTKDLALMCKLSS